MTAKGPQYEKYPLSYLITLVKETIDNTAIPTEEKVERYRDITKALEKMPVPSELDKTQRQEFEKEVKAFKSEIQSLLKEKAAKTGAEQINQRAAMTSVLDDTKSSLKTTAILKNQITSLATSLLPHEEYWTLSNKDLRTLQTIYALKSDERSLMEKVRQEKDHAARNTLLIQIEGKRHEISDLSKQIDFLTELLNYKQKTEALLQENPSQTISKGLAQISLYHEEAEKLLKQAVNESNPKIYAALLNQAKFQTLKAKITFFDVNILVHLEKTEQYVRQAQASKGKLERPYLVNLAKIEVLEAQKFIAQLEMLEATVLAKQARLFERNANYKSELIHLKGTAIFDEIKQTQLFTQQSAEKRFSESNQEIMTRTSGRSEGTESLEGSALTFRDSYETVQEEDIPRQSHEDILSTVDLRIANEQYQEAIRLITQFEENINQNKSMPKQEKEARLQGIASARTFVEDLKGQKNILPLLKTHAAEKLKSARDEIGAIKTSKEKPASEGIALKNKLLAENQLLTHLCVALSRNLVITPSAQAHGIHKLASAVPQHKTPPSSKEGAKVITDSDANKYKP